MINKKWITIEFKVVLAIITVYCSMVFSWEDIGHKTIAVIALKNLHPETVKKIDLLLPPGQSMEDLSIAADYLKEKEKYPASWHIIKVSVQQEMTKDDIHKIEKSGRHEGYNVVSQTEKNIEFLKKGWGTTKEKKEALMFLIHFVGDLHMPLHVGDDNFQGGIRKQVTFYSPGSPSKRGFDTNLHSLWDNLLKEKAVENSKDLGAKLNGEISASEKGEWEKGTIEDWAFESYTISKKIYTGIPERRMVFSLPNNYYSEMRPIVDKQLEKAGIRLAILLEQLFGK
jgi:hypothetical protein